MDSFEDIQKRAAAGEKDAQYALGLEYIKRSELRNAFKWFYAAAIKGHADSQHAIGVMYVNECPKRPIHTDTKTERIHCRFSKAVVWFKEAAQQGHLDAQARLGMAFKEGQGEIKPDNEEAVKWWRGAAEHGHSLAQHNLAYMYASGCGVPHSYISAYAWASLASTLSNQAKIMLKELEGRLTPDEIIQARSLSRELHKEIEARKKAAGK